MIRLTIKRRIMLLYTMLTTALLAILLPIVYGTVSASLNLDIQSRLNNAIAQVLIAVDDQDEKFVLTTKWTSRIISPCAWWMTTGKPYSPQQEASGSKLRRQTRPGIQSIEMKHTRF